MDVGHVARRRQLFQAPCGPARQHHGRLAAGQIGHPHVPPKNPLFQACTQCLGTGLLGGEALSVSRGALGWPALGPGALLLSVNAMDEPLAEPRQRLLDAANVDDVRTDAYDHALAVLGARSRGVDPSAHFDDGGAEPRKDRFANQEVANIELGNLGNGGDRRDRVVIDAMTGVDLKAQRGG